MTSLADRQYAWRFLRKYHVRYRHSCVQMMRSLWIVIVHGHIGETCRDCGRRYLLWMASDDLYVEVTGGNGSQFCLACFGKRAERLGISVMWVPHVWRRDGVENMMDVAHEIGAFKPLPDALLTQEDA
jgi:hypothetical protein